MPKLRQHGSGKRRGLVSIFSRHCFSILVASSLAVTSFLIPGQHYQFANAATNAYCQLNDNQVTQKEQLLQLSLEGNSQARQEYQSLIAEHATIMQQCRQQNWPQEQAIWLRLYPCDVSPGSIDYVLDRVVNQGYNRVHLEVFYDSQVLLPPADNPTPWSAIVRSPGGDNVDLLKQTIKKGHQRGLKVYAWLFTMNFGYSYAQRQDRQEALARNGEGENSLTFVSDRSQAFIDPYNRQVQEDYHRLVNAVLKRKPDGILFDYIRYPRGSGNQSLVNNVKDLWIYSPASLQTLYNRGTNEKGRALIKKYVNQGNITLKDIKDVDLNYPEEGEPSWQGRPTSSLKAKASLRDRHLRLKSELWFFTVAHAAQGVIDFLSFAAAPAQQQNIPAGGVFFPDANRLVGNAGFDSRLQAWDKFPGSLEWHPMAYSVCDGTDCIVKEIEKVIDNAPQGTEVIPALAGVWGQEYRKHPSLEQQMASLHRAFPEINSVSHFAYSWQEPEVDRQRKFCNLQ
ncbi:family 10 glycosylhydrolase [Hyella patelloides]|nr:family 10 glycosylhydrolase [Hyella patelloides]